MGVLSLRGFQAGNIISDFFSCVKRSFLFAAVLLALFFLGIAPVKAQPSVVDVSHDWAFIPSGLAVGSEFRLIFITQGRRDAQSSDIDVYNTFVQSQAAGGHSALNGQVCGYTYASLFKVLGSTGKVDARDNTGTRGTGVPIYWMSGSKVADDYNDFYDGSWENSQASDRRNQNGVVPTGIPLNDWPWTGSDNDGTAHNNDFLGSTNVRQGGLNDQSPLSHWTSTNSQSHSFYALSPVFRIVENFPLSVPKPYVVPPSSTLIPSAGLGCNGNRCVGYSFRLMFLTEDSIAGDSNSISFYDDHVQKAAAKNSRLRSFSGKFRALVSTQSVNARVNTGTSDSLGEPILWLDSGGNGALIAKSNSELYSSGGVNWTNRGWSYSGDVRTEFGNSPSGGKENNWPWTGTDSDGSTSADGSLGCGSAVIGKFIEDESNMPQQRIPINYKGDIIYTSRLYGPINSGEKRPVSESRPIYGLSPGSRL